MKGFSFVSQGRKQMKRYNLDKTVPKHFVYRGCFRESQVCFQTVLLSMFKDIEDSTLTTA